MGRAVWLLRFDAAENLIEDVRRVTGRRGHRAVVTDPDPRSAPVHGVVAIDERHGGSRAIRSSHPQLPYRDINGNGGATAAHASTHALRPISRAHTSRIPRTGSSPRPSATLHELHIDMRPPDSRRACRLHRLNCSCIRHTRERLRPRCA